MARRGGTSAAQGQKPEIPPSAFGLVQPLCPTQVAHISPPMTHKLLAVSLGDGADRHCVSALKGKPQQNS